MIRNKLSDLLGQRQMKISKLSYLTGIARSTLTPIYSNHSEMIRLETINKICKALNINVKDFFESVNFDIEFHKDNNAVESIISFMTSDIEGIDTYNINVAVFCEINDKPVMHLFEVIFETTDDTSINDTKMYIGNDKKDIWTDTHSSITYRMIFNDEDEEEIFKKYMDQLSVGMKVVLKNKAIEFIREYLMTYFKDDLDNQDLDVPKMTYEDVFKKAKIDIVNF